MYSYFEGKVTEVTATKVDLEINGIGYEIFATTSALKKAATAERIKLYTYLNIKEDEMSLYGFSDKFEKNMFLNLISISGIGPKLAMSVLGGLELTDLASSIISGDAARLNKIKGVGKKTAERIIVELRDKLAKEYKDIGEQPSEQAFGVSEDAVLYLMAMGLTKAEAIRKIKTVVGAANMSLEQLVIAALAAK